MGIKMSRVVCVCVRWTIRSVYWSLLMRRRLNPRASGWRLSTSPLSSRPPCLLLS